MNQYHSNLFHAPLLQLQRSSELVNANRCLEPCSKLIRQHFNNTNLLVKFWPGRCQFGGQIRDGSIFLRGLCRMLSDCGRGMLTLREMCKLHMWSMWIHLFRAVPIMLEILLCSEQVSAIYLSSIGDCLIAYNNRNILCFARPSPIFLTFTIILNLIPAPISLGVAIANISQACGSPVAVFLIISAAINILMISFASYLYWRFSQPYQEVRVRRPISPQPAHSVTTPEPKRYRPG